MRRAAHAKATHKSTSKPTLLNPKPYLAWDLVVDFSAYNKRDMKATVESTLAANTDLYVYISTDSVYEVSEYFFDKKENAESSSNSGSRSSGSSSSSSSKTSQAQESLRTQH